ncbi:sigma 54-interacting transcriptional regulator [uncultured Clostridium sp.]|jgi:transcriptional regulator with PAS, ATPase and Fis domain/phosphotransferase system HPr-like phosphotransfer protein|uniref:sigma 54-interacting transcriptional regulator n=1 Tax=uncultured Clostridium sp. TaxID=59620 RepID=UPI00260FE747|nr:sigma 54-interacting transcriptional regulator [uncultured Clostridium sp.]
MYNQSLKIKVPSGIHTRFAAMIVNKAAEIKSKYKLNIFIKKEDYTDWLGVSMLGILALKLSKNDIVSFGCKESGMIGKLAIGTLLDYIETNINSSIEVTPEIDGFIDESNIANEQVLDELPVGIIAIDIHNNITKINSYALNLLEKSIYQTLGQPIKKLIPNSELADTLLTKSKEMGKILYINNKTTIVNRSPIFSHGELIGAISVIQDISDMVGLKEINEKFTKILENSSELICFVDESGKINYVNPTYTNTLLKNGEKIIGKDIFTLSPKGLRAKCFKSKESMKNVLHSKNGIDIISKIDPIFIDGKFKGIISTSKPVNELKGLIDKLERSEEELNFYKEEFLKSVNSSSNNIIGATTSLKDIMYICEKGAKSTSTVLVRGESGTGKELIAKFIHNESKRQNMPFVRVNCAAIPENLLESELFGYEKGSFTGASKAKPGKFEIADGGTIFLDEIGDMPMSMQVKLLRVLQEMEIERIGALHPKKIDVRVIAATNRNLEEMMLTNKFREDLFYRLNVLTVSLPPLRERKTDLPILINHFIDKLNKKLSTNIISIDFKALNVLESYNFPGNIRELENIIERALNLCNDNIIKVVDFPPYIIPSDSKDLDILELDTDNILPFEEYEKKIIVAAMKKYKTFNKAGKALGLTHRTISLKCQKYDIARVK